MGKLVSCGADGMLRWWDVPSQKPKLAVQRDQAIPALAASRDGTRLAVGYSQSGVECFDSGTGESLWRVETDAPLDAVTFSPDEVLVAWADTRGVALPRLRRACSGANCERRSQTRPRPSPQVILVEGLLDQEHVRSVGALTGAMGFSFGTPALRQFGFARLVDAIDGERRADDYD